MQRAGLWRAGELPAVAGLATSHAALDGLLPGGGWPRSGLTEILSAEAGIGALRLVLPALARLSGEDCWIIWVSPPHVPYSPALSAHGVDLARMLIVDWPDEPGAAKAQALWAYEQALRFTDCAAALLWLEHASHLELRRLQLAAESGGTWGIVFRPERYAAQASPAPCRLRLEPAPGAVSATGPHSRVQVTLLKARGGQPGARCVVQL